MTFTHSTVHHEFTLPRASDNLEILTSLGSSITISGLSTWKHLMWRFSIPCWSAWK